MFCSLVIFRRNHQTSASVNIEIHTKLVTKSFHETIGDFWSSYIRKKQPKYRYKLNRQKPVVISQGKQSLDNKLLVEHSLPSRRRLARTHRKAQMRSNGPPTRPEEQLSSNNMGDLKSRFRQWEGTPLGWSQFYNDLVEWVRLFKCSDYSTKSYTLDNEPYRFYETLFAELLYCDLRETLKYSHFRFEGQSFIPFKTRRKC